MVFTKLGVASLVLAGILTFFVPETTSADLVIVCIKTTAEIAMTSLGHFWCCRVTFEMDCVFRCTTSLAVSWLRVSARCHGPGSRMNSKTTSPPKDRFMPRCLHLSVSCKAQLCLSSFSYFGATCAGHVTSYLRVYRLRHKGQSRFLHECASVTHGASTASVPFMGLGIHLGGSSGSTSTV